MKICWDNLERLRYNKKTGKWYSKTSSYIYREKCEFCGEDFLSHNNKGRFCDQECFKKSDEYKDNIIKTHKGKKLSKSHIEIISKTHKGKIISEETRKKQSRSAKTRFKNKENHPFYGKHHTEKTKKKLGSYRGDKTSNWKGGVTKKNLPLYDTYATQLEWAEEIRCNKEDPNILEVKCTYCGRWFVPSYQNVKNRIGHLKGYYVSEHRFYCSEECKRACPLYNKTPEALMKEDAVRAGRLGWLELNREVQPELRQMVLKRDNYMCVKCGSEGPLHCHHILPVAVEPLLSADVDNCITLCEKCHKEAHRLPGCSYNEIKIEEC
jgi:hypothetical protein